MNRLSVGKQSAILRMLVEGASLRSISRTQEVSINTVTKLLVDAGTACADYHHEAVRDVPARFIQCDEIWSFCYAKRNHLDRAIAAPREAGDVWTWTAIDPESKLLISWRVGMRDFDTGIAFMEDLRFRVMGRPQISTDGLRVYRDTVEEVFGADVDFAMLVKEYDKRGRYVRSHKEVVMGQPDLRRVSTALVERQNLNIRESIRRYTRQSLGFSKKWANHCHTLAVYFVWYNWCRKHKTLKMTPAMAAGLAGEPHNMRWLVGLISN